MTVLTALQSAGIRLVGQRLTSFFQSTDTLPVELCDLVNETARDIATKHDWRRLTLLETITGDGATTSFDLPTDYDRMLIKGDVHSSTWEQWRYHRVQDLDEWQDLQTFSAIANPGSWIILAGAFQVYPAIPTGEEAKFYYISRDIVAPTSGANKAAFTADTDTFLLDERLLTLGVIWRWRAQKRLEYAEDMANYERELEASIGKDKGSRILTSGPRRFPGGDVRLAYPRALG
jgi:hypothetical protein